MATGQAKMNNFTKSAPSTADSSIKSDAELINAIQHAFAEKNSALLLAERQIQEQARFLEDLRTEASGLLVELHKTQEALEQACKSQRATSEQAIQQQARIDKLKALLPDHWEMEVKDIHRKRKAATEIICWTLKDVYITGAYIPELYVEVHLRNGDAGVVLKRTISNSMTSSAQFGKLANGDTITIFPESKPVNQGANAEISNLGTSDWNASREILRRLTSLVENSEFSHSRLKKKDVGVLRTGLVNLNQRLNNWPWIFRFDAIQLSETLQTHEYQKLTFRIENLSIGNFTWSRLDYGIATVDHDGSFGQNPRLEFPESSKQVVSNWYPETLDGRGARLELRFAKPNAFDWNVWTRLSNEDRLLITALVTSIPSQIAALDRQGIHMQDWQKWNELGLVMRSILASQFEGMTNRAG
ncbi:MULTISPECIES: hypothetical protein [Pseudomonas]|uniref:hypothetical protein n=1 Tax=Pseudomonas TaxID=286 RepID=UPI00137B11E6|nr:MULTISPECIES: hypothetical protein [Pseudomonas]WBM34204.1 hypothetical protein M2J80_07025 [Pseudomonas sp. NY11382]